LTVIPEFARANIRELRGPAFDTALNLSKGGCEAAAVASWFDKLTMRIKGIGSRI
jgi:hypothetical protein